MDVSRYLRALQAEEALGLERKRAAWLAGVLNINDLTQAEWAIIEEHDRLVNDGA